MESAQDYASWLRDGPDQKQETALGARFKMRYIESDDSETDCVGEYDDFEVRVPRNEKTRQAWRGQMSFGGELYNEDSDDQFADGDGSEDSWNNYEEKGTNEGRDEDEDA